MREPNPLLRHLRSAPVDAVKAETGGLYHKEKHGFRIFMPIEVARPW